MSRISLLVLLIVLLTSCNQQSQNTDNDTIKIGVIQSDSHPAFDAAREGFITVLSENGFVDGENISIDIKNALGDQSNLKSIATGFVSDEMDLILAIGTQSSLAIATETKDIPILITAVTDPLSEKLVVSLDKPGTNVTGTSDLTPVDAQIELIKQLLPDTRKLAIMYSSKESNSAYQASIAKESAAKYEMIPTEITVSSKSDIVSVAQSLIGNYDAVYIPTDNDFASAMSAVASVCVPNNLPTIAGEESMTSQGGVFSYSLSYLELGKLTGEMGVSILKGEQKPEDIPIRYLEDYTLIVNKNICDKMNINLPEEILKDAKIVGIDN